MADYTIYDPASLDNLDPATPADAEDASKLSAAIRQTKSVIDDVIQKEHNADGTHKTLDKIIAQGSVTGDKISSSGTDNSKRAIGTDHIRDGSVTKEKLAVKAISAELLEDGSVTEPKLGSQAVNSGNIKPGAVQGTHLADNSIGSNALSPGSVGNEELKIDAVTADKVKDNTLGADKLSLAQNLMIAGGANAIALACAVGGALQLVVDEATNPPTARFAVRPGDSILPILVIREAANEGGTAVASTWNVRPAGPGVAWTVDYDGGGILVGPPNNRSFFFRKKGLFLVFAFAVAFKINFHQIRLRDLTNSRTLIVGSLSEADAGINSQSSSVMMGIMELTVDNTEIQLHHYTSAGLSTNGLGRGVGSSNGEPQTLAAMVFIQLS